MMKTGEMIKEIRKIRKITQNELADKIGVKLSALQKYESGAIENIKIGTLRKLCDSLNVIPFFLIYPDQCKMLLPDLHTYKKDVNSIKILQNNKFDKAIFKLNPYGVNKVIEYACDLSEINRYTK